MLSVQFTSVWTAYHHDFSPTTRITTLKVWGCRRSMNMDTVCQGYRRGLVNDDVCPGAANEEAWMSRVRNTMAQRRATLFSGL